MQNLIQNTRKAAEQILKPSKRDLDYGFNLHKDSIVFDAYGFAPASAPDGEALKRLAEDGATQRELKDALEEMSMLGHLCDSQKKQEVELAWEASGVTCIFQNAGEEGQSPGRLMKRLGRFTYAVDADREFYHRAVFAEDALQAKENAKHCLYYSLNGVPLFQQWNSPEEELGFIRVFYQLGARMMHLTYNRRNLIGDGCGEKIDSGLSDFGEMVVDEMNRAGVIVDVAHSGPLTSLTAARRSSRPMVASHAAAQAVNDHIRSKSDQVIKAIADTDGFVGICCIPGFLGKSGDINALLDHIEYVARKFGADRVAIGTDRSCNSPKRQEELQKASLPRARTRWGALWPTGTLGLSSRYSEEAIASLSWTNWPLFTVGLVQRGFSDEEIRKIIGGNVLRVLGAAFS